MGRGEGDVACEAAGRVDWKIVNVMAWIEENWRKVCSGIGESRLVVVWW